VLDFQNSEEDNKQSDLIIKDRKSQEKNSSDLSKDSIPKTKIENDEDSQEKENSKIDEESEIKEDLGKVKGLSLKDDYMKENKTDNNTSNSFHPSFPYKRVTVEKNCEKLFNSSDKFSITVREVDQQTSPGSYIVIIKGDPSRVIEK